MNAVRSINHSKLDSAIPAAILIAAAIVYGLLLPYTNTDIDVYLVPWYDYILGHGRFASLGDNFSNYSPPYLYLLSLCTLADGLLHKVILIKILSILGAVFLAICAYILLRQLIHTRTALMASSTLLLLPSVAINSSFWGQCDAIYCGFVVLAIAFAIRGHGLPAAVMFGTALAFKAQAIFVAPFGLYLLLAGIIRPSSTLAAAAAFFAWMVPAWIAGRPIADLATIYLSQADYYKQLSLNAPNIWLYIEYDGLLSYDVGTKLAMVLAATAALCIALVAVVRKMKSPFDLMLIALLSSIALPYLLPKMHDRYFFMADVLSFLLAWAFRSSSTALAAVLICVGSLLAYSSFLLGFQYGAGIGGIFTTAALTLVSTMFTIRAFPQTAKSLPMLAGSMRGIGDAETMTARN